MFIYSADNPIFVQKRIGKNGRIFNLIKFRSPKSHEKHDSATGLGNLIRVNSIDELSQLFNVERGEMSLVAQIITILSILRP